MIFWRWIALSIWHGIVLFFGVRVAMQGTKDDDGITYEHWEASTLIFTLVIHLIVCKLFLETIHWNVISIISGLISIIFYYITVLLMNINDLSILL